MVRWSVLSTTGSGGFSALDRRYPASFASKNDGIATRLRVFSNERTGLVVGRRTFTILC